MDICNEEDHGEICYEDAYKNGKRQTCSACAVITELRSEISELTDKLTEANEKVEELEADK